ncbi:hypothetical protein PCASD_19705 [Puccinia coronata f. sp. avenae]|uniref:Uncharacterized protein n=1 Tax=Puccinia coronata f. sp. avenae TaxID=200324 RepID=A0A2N5SKZ1_9BASI|nr:hypothetical protein PCASD_19705 [Puccinia coronata f. sp. avenae]
MSEEENHQSDNSVSSSETPLTSSDGTLGESKSDTSEFEVCTPYEGKPPHTADPQITIHECYLYWDSQRKWINDTLSIGPTIPEPGRIARREMPSFIPTISWYEDSDALVVSIKRKSDPETF